MKISALLFTAVIAATAGCGAKPATPRARGTGVASAESDAAPANLLELVPASTPYVVYFSRAMEGRLGGNGTVAEASLAAAREWLEKALLAPAAMRAASPVERLSSELAREVLPFDAALVGASAGSRDRARWCCTVTASCRSSA